MKKFAQRVYEQLMDVPKGKVTTYKLLAQAIGTKACRAVGSALRCNPYAPNVPCHRVIASNMTLGGFRGSKEVKTLAQKRKLLASEGITFSMNKVNTHHLFDFNRIK